jgi:hypothetical protein
VKVSLYIAGAVLELLGVVSLGLPDVIPFGRRFSRWLAARFLRVRNFVRRLLRRKWIIRVVESGGLSLEGSNVMTVFGITPIGGDIPLEEQVALLRAHDVETQKRMNQFDDRLVRFEQGTSARIDETRAELQSNVAAALARARVEYRALRIAGAIALLIGLGLSTSGNLVN